MHTGWTVLESMVEKGWKAVPGSFPTLGFH